MWGDKSQLLSFNSTTVQLILMERQQQYNKELFQFHNGTINTFVPRSFVRQMIGVSIPQRYN